MKAGEGDGLSVVDVPDYIQQQPSCNNRTITSLSDHRRPPSEQGTENNLSRPSDPEELQYHVGKGFQREMEGTILTLCRFLVLCLNVGD